MARQVEHGEEGEETEPIDPTSAGGSSLQGARRFGVRGWLVGGSALLGALGIFVAVTALTGLPGPGPLRRYTSSELSRAVELIHAEAGDIRTPDDCWRLIEGAEGPLREVARVDHLRSRVVVRAWASDDGEVDPVTLGRVSARLAAVVAAHPEVDKEMIVVEPSPDGWSTNVSCARILRSVVTGF